MMMRRSRSITTAAAAAAVLSAEHFSRTNHAVLSRGCTLNNTIYSDVAGAASRAFSKLPPLLNPKLFSTAIHGGGGVIDETEGEELNDVDDNDEWEEEEEVEAMYGDGGDGGGVVLGDVAWGSRALSLVREVLDNFAEDTVLYAFRVSLKGYIYVRLDKLTNKYGCLDLEEMEKFSKLYKGRLDEVGQSGEIPDNLALEVSSPGAERLLKVPEDLDRFKQMPMCVYFLEEIHDSKHQQPSEKILMLESIDSESQQCVWKLANVKENREELGKGRPLSRKQRDWRLTLTFQAIDKVQLYLDAKIK